MHSSPRIAPAVGARREARPYQVTASQGIRTVWARGGTPLLVLPTGAGKTFVFALEIRDHDGPAVAIAHRRELIGQMSLALAREGVVHRIIAPSSVVRQIVRANIEELGLSCYSPSARVAVASVDSIRRAPEEWVESVTLAVIDEGHHVLEENKWGKALRRFPNAKILGVTATPERADGRGLGAHAEGVFTDLVVGPPMRMLIEWGYLSDYRVIVAESDLDLSDVPSSRVTGDYVAPKMRAAVHRSHITGDIVAEYRKRAMGKLGVTFAADVACAVEIAGAFNDAGVPAAVVHAKTPASERAEAIRRFTKREILQLVNVDIFGEGFDLPAIEVCSFGRPTQSWPFHCQAFGRALRPMEGKEYALIIDHVGNTMRPGLGLPDRVRTYSLDSRSSRTAPTSPDDVRVCSKCAGAYRRVLLACPYCGDVPTATNRAAPVHVDGDLIELDPEVLDEMRGAVERVDMDPAAYEQELIRRGCPAVGLKRNVRRHEARQTAQQRLRNAMGWWRGVRATEGLSERESYRYFFLAYGVDALSARALGEKEADALCERILADLPYSVRCLS